jgi:hypothetical protein
MYVSVLGLRVKITAMYSQTILNHMIGLTFVEYSMQIEQGMLVIITLRFSILNFSNPNYY